MGFQNVVVGRINGVVALTGFSYEEMYGRFAGTKKSGRNNEVVVRRGSIVLYHAVCSYTSEAILGDPGAVSRVGRKGGTRVFNYGQKSPSEDALRLERKK